MGQYIMTCPDCGTLREFIEGTLTDECLLCGYSFKEKEKPLTVEQEASIRLAPYFNKVRRSGGKD